MRNSYNPLVLSGVQPAQESGRRWHLFEQPRASLMDCQAPSKQKANNKILHILNLNKLSIIKLDDRVARKQVGGREQIEGKKSEVTEDE